MRAFPSKSSLLCLRSQNFQPLGPKTVRWSKVAERIESGCETDLDVVHFLWKRKGWLSFRCHLLVCDRTKLSAASLLESFGRIKLFEGSVVDHHVIPPPFVVCSSLDLGKSLTNSNDGVLNRSLRDQLVDRYHNEPAERSSSGTGRLAHLQHGPTCKHSEAEDGGTALTTKVSLNIMTRISAGNQGGETRNMIAGIHSNGKHNMDPYLSDFASAIGFWSALENVEPMLAKGKERKERKGKMKLKVDAKANIIETDQGARCGPDFSSSGRWEHLLTSRNLGSSAAAAEESRDEETPLIHFTRSPLLPRKFTSQESLIRMAWVIIAKLRKIMFEKLVAVKTTTPKKYLFFSSRELLKSCIFLCWALSLDLSKGPKPRVLKRKNKTNTTKKAQREIESYDNHKTRQAMLQVKRSQATGTAPIKPRAMNRRNKGTYKIHCAFVLKGKRISGNRIEDR
ncbi:uncharacterized protein BDR25DRAFT_354999 [Lindgomyces ingoldianus]|uniref:Uncharacterized protein n=1 Tax=Lindgomyces ingoldianus TaxID=673940 RepID=A0ACB6QW38_9PLEO|nr:uncharacterized protein BDR25DRAFT_354999 [Lindgomyces ingoldianus]KAF2471090.1 hypothetical protein BDR25DRAFT_354999 [Lindgomyces ingoldianus]